MSSDYSPTEIAESLANINVNTVTLNRIKRTLVGEGTYGRVYIQDNGDGSKVAVKQLKGDSRIDSDNSFVIEVSALERLREQDGIIDLISYDYEVGEITLPRYTEDLSEYIKNKRDYRPKASIAYDILLGLHSQFSNGVLHRDIKSKNILVNQDEAVLADYGLAAYIDTPTNIMTTQVYTVGYRPPEIIAGMNTYEFAADIWAYGIVLYELFTGKTISIITPEATLRFIAELIGTNDILPSLSKSVKSNPLPQLNKDLDNGKLTIDEYNLLKYILKWKPQDRPDPSQISAKPYFVDYPKIGALPPGELIIDRYQFLYNKITLSMDNINSSISKTKRALLKNVAIQMTKKYELDNPNLKDIYTLFLYLLPYIADYIEDSKDIAKSLVYLCSNIIDQYSIPIDVIDDVPIVDVAAVLGEIITIFNIIPIRFLRQVPNYTQTKVVKLIMSLLDMKHIDYDMATIIKYIDNGEDLE